MTKAQVKLLTADAKNRAWRTTIQGLGIDVLVAASITIYQIVSDPKPIVWAFVGASLFRTCLQAAASFVMRRFLDASKIPTPLPPDPPGLPADEVETAPATASRTAKKTTKKTAKKPAA